VSSRSESYVSPDQLWKHAHNNPLNNHSYDLNKFSCHEWVMHLAQLVGLADDITAVLCAEREQYKMVNWFVDAWKPKISKLQNAERARLRHEARQKNLNKLPAQQSNSSAEAIRNKRHHSDDKRYTSSRFL